MSEERQSAEAALSRLRAATARLAASASEQRAYLAKDPGLGECTDELALEWEDECGFLPLLASAGLLSPSADAALRRVDAELDSLSEDATAWTFRSLESDPRWERVRAAARLALLELGSSQER